MFSKLPKSTLVPIAFGSVYLLWGSTYLAIKVAGQNLPVAVVGGCRSLLSTVLMATICLVLGKSMRVPKGEGWKLVLIGLLFMSGNNLMLVWGETMVPSGFASLVVSTMPIMIALMEMVLGLMGKGGDALNKRGWAGTLLGTAGITVLVWPSLHGHAQSGNSRPLLGAIVLLTAAFSFAVGSVLSRRFQFKADTFVATGWQLGSAGIFNMSLAIVTGGLKRAVWTVHGVEAVVYLSVFGSICGLVAFTYLLQNVAVTKVSTYAFVNPVIAVLLGVVLLHERLASTEVVGMGVIICAVAMVVYSRMDRGKREIVGMAGDAVE